jgi:hypothetical protein
MSRPRWVILKHGFKLTQVDHFTPSYGCLALTDAQSRACRYLHKRLSHFEIWTSLRNRPLQLHSNRQILPPDLEGLPA